MTSFDLKNFKEGDVKQLILDLSKNSSEEIKSSLERIYIASSRNEDMANEIIEKGGVETLINLYNSAQGKTFRGQITSILVLFSCRGKENVYNSADIALIALSNISKSDLNTFLQCISGIRAMAVFSTPSPASGESSPPPLTPAHFLTVSTAALLLENASSLLSSPTHNDTAKQNVLSALMELVESGAMNEAAEFVGWRQSQGEGGAGGGKEKEGKIPAIRFSEAFEAFGEVMKKIATDKRKFLLSAGAKQVCQSIKEKNFFPTFDLSLSEQQAPSLKARTEMPACINYGNSSPRNGKVMTLNGGSVYFCTSYSVGIFKINLKINLYGNTLYVGFFPQTRFDGLCMCSHIHPGSSSGFSFCSNGNLYFNGTNKSGNSVFTSSNTFISIELNFAERTAHLFINNTQQPSYFARIHPLVFPSLLGSSNTQVEFVSEERLPVPTVVKSKSPTANNVE